MGQSASKRTERNLRLRNRLWPDINDDMVWNWRNKKGFVPVPRPMPYFFQVMDELSKGKPVSSTYFALWTRMWDESCMVTIKDPLALANESKFSGQRALSTWKDRIKKLEELGFIKTQPSANFEFGYVIILNPYHSVKKLYDEGKYENKGVYNSLIEYAENIKVDDLDESPLKTDGKI